MGFRGGPGTLKRRITFQRFPDPEDEALKDSLGEVTGEPTDDFTCFAAYQPIGGKEFPVSEKRHAETTGRFWIRYRRDINPRTLPATHRISYVENASVTSPVTRTYDIRAVASFGFVEMHIEVSEIR
jgi:head-tail adaptor